MQNYKFLKERIENLGGNDFLDTSWKAQYMKESLIGWISLKVKTSLLPRHCQENEKTGHTWEKIYAKGISNKGLISKMYKEILKLSNKKTNNLI